MSRHNPYWPTPDERDEELVRLGLITEEERIRRAYERIHADMLKRRFGR